ncbi:MAG TPA: RHS repeat-associated core domain-containing protein [Leptospiraceae bacterium]|nr:RHS repeat-associated core domain-containing protein [Leptospiraceae bacterium]HMX34460.1 RHS repeat-associated core domain-containing protein [Leptospiraceae bacterium]HMY34260.1 RHS repeat-associated core domain-containing protein [Leptospiraceae bacterium]HMZ64700.1 RHS repeat-associated core domain-containing protein [Leptospiraceae bacterium]HNA08951.1 RHS repeat-associated core domain-containing protein [Leptospiraceae bacterium]
MNNANQHQSPALRMEAWSINCIFVYISMYAANGNLLTVADSLPAHYVEYLFLMRLILLIHIVRRTPNVLNPDGGETTASEYYDLLGRSIRKESPGVQNLSIVETTEYDAKGQVYRKSNPYLETLETPVYTTYTYNPYEGYVNRIDHPDSRYTTISYNGFNESSQTYASDASLIQSQDLVKNAKGQTLSRTIDGLTISYQYDAASRVTKVLDAMSGATTTVYDDAGRRKSVTDENSGTTSYTYDLVGNIKTQTDARNITTTFTYDNLNRPTGVSYSNGEGNTVLTYDEGGQAKYALGRLTTVVDAAGKLELAYDIKGNRIYQKRKIDDLEIIFRREYDLQNRLASTTYPDGTKVYQKYATTGHFSGITMDTADGSSKGYTVGSYRGPVIEDGQFKIIRETGNGVKMEIQYDPIKRRPIGLVTKLASGHIENAESYTYDQKNNITKIADTIVNGRTQDFVYDAQNRLTKATGKYGVENYTYSDNGNLTQRGNFTLAYGDANHKHAVTAVTSPSTGTFNYSYDEAGNMISRNGDAMSYNSQGKLKQIDTAGGDKLVYLYDSTGNRIKKTSKTSKTSGVVAYSFDTFDGLSAGSLYEITRTPGEGDKHTLYFKGLYGDTFSQMTRNDAALITDASNGSKSSNLFDVALSTGILSFAKGDDSPPNLSLKSFLCSNVAGSCFDYYKNTAKFYYLKGAVKVASVIYTVEYDVFVWILLVVVLYLVYLFSNKKTVIEFIEMTTSGIGQSIVTSTSSATDSWFAKRTLSVTPLLTIAILFTFTQCGFVGGKTKGNAPWLLLASGINGNTQSVDDPSNGSGSSGGGGGSSIVPVIGMFFLHPDHLGSITMITDGRGNLIAGGNNGGKSHISYKPYGEIDRTDSSGPDISKFKFTGQEEDKESGLMYYKARYYDRMIGRFLQADSMVFTDRTMGMNRYMYVEGNPVRFGDDSGHKRQNGDQERQLNYLTVAAVGFDSGGLEGAALAVAGMQNAKNRTERLGDLQITYPRHHRYSQRDALADVAHAFQRAAHDINHFNNHAIPGGFKWASHGAENAAHTYSNLLFGKYHHRNSPLDQFYRTGIGRIQKKYNNYLKTAFTRNRYCIRAGVETAFFIWAAYDVAAFLIFDQGAGLASPSLAGRIAALIASETGLAGPASTVAVAGINVIANTNTLIGPGAQGMLNDIQHCSIKSL